MDLIPNVWLLAAAIISSQSIEALSNFHIGLPEKDLQRYFGSGVRKTVPEYEIVSPEHIQGSRHRRSLLAPKEPLKYNLTAFGEVFSLHLEHNDNLLPPGCLVHQFQANQTKKVQACPIYEHDCYYHGTLLTHNASTMAFSVCHGLTGFIHLPDRDYDLWILPVDRQHVERARRSADLANPHLIYKRAASDRGCTTDGLPIVKSTKRRRREAGDKYLEMLLVADTTMFEYHGEKVVDYILTLANVAARLMLDSSLGTPIHLTVTQVMVLETEQADLQITKSVDTTLKSFCNWQEKFNPESDDNPKHYDGAALFTRLDVVHNDVEDTTGYANFGGLCTPRNRCSYNQDDGLAAGVTLAHETGHTFGLQHDGQRNACENNKYIMSSSGSGGYNAMSWSPCSRQELDNFLHSGSGWCLSDKPQNEDYSLPKDLPGVVYDGNDQCELRFGEGSTLCLGTNLTAEYEHDECARLICYDPNIVSVCRGDALPRMDGTMCGERKYCLHGQCVDIGPDGPSPRDGSWSQWETEWSACSRTCGGGVRTRRRMCNSPKPSLGGQECVGSNLIAELCNIQDCDDSQEDHKAAQCASTDSDPVLGIFYHWEPYTTLGTQQCELFCIHDQRTIQRRYLDGRPWYKDGTTCTPVDGASSSFGRCVDGKCLAFGCDGKTDSGFRYDKCGVCGGEGNTCRSISGTYSNGEKGNYVTFLVIPKDASSIIIENANSAFSQLTLKVGNAHIFNAVSNKPDRAGIYARNGVVVNYNPGYSNAGLERIKVNGPLTTPLEVQVWREFSDTEFQNVAPQISYQYYVPFNPLSSGDYIWESHNGECNKICGGGHYEQIITCTKKSDGTSVDEHFCDVRQKPSVSAGECNNQPCPPRWRAGNYGACSVTCGRGQKTRLVECVRDTEVIDSAGCPANSRPTEVESCSQECPPNWITGAWSQCSLTCGKGTQKRDVSCARFATETEPLPLPDSECSADSKPISAQPCVLAVCFPEIVGDACKDHENCVAYDDNMCHQYPEFAQQNCMKSCSFCSAGAESCTDNSTDCTGYGSTVCEQYADWAKINCAKMCGHCPSVPDTGLCTDINADCAGYGSKVCEQYAEWAKTNCAKMCGHCPTVQSVESCTDNNTDCAGYGSTVCDQYADWAKTNCAKMCGHCSVQGEHNADCQDLSSDCAGYGASICTSYADWANINCRRFCNKCSGRSRRSLAHSISMLPLSPPGLFRSCNKVFTASKGSLNLIGQPLPMPCTVIIAAPLKVQVYINFTAINLNCQKGERLEVLEESTMKKKGKVYRDLCSQTGPLEWISLSNVVTLKLSVLEPGHGYNLTYSMKMSSPPSPLGCERLLTNPSGVISRPGSPHSQLNSHFCQFTILAPPGFSVQLKFSKLELEGENCASNKLTIFDEEENTSDKFCGNSSGLIWQSKGNKVKVVFANNKIQAIVSAAYRFITP